MGRERHADIERQKGSTARDRAKMQQVQRAEAPAHGIAAMASGGDILALQRMIGNAAVNQLLRQYALTAAQVRRTAAPIPSSRAVQRHAEGEDGVVQALPTAQRLHAVSAANNQDNIGARIRAAVGGGSALDGGVRRTLEAGLGAGLSGVRVHTSGEADHLSRSVQAVAFTTGADIFFRSGAYNPSTPGGLHLLAHEAAHTVQQAQGPVAGTPHPGGVSISDPSDSFERAAEAVAARVTTPPLPARRYSAMQRKMGGTFARLVVSTRRSAPRRAACRRPQP
jgi:hypothetical protein